ncbi:MAG: glycosyltransferase [Bacteroidales bacterium]|nr:glycosyltransferase [Bacteroidales bacterium]MDD3962311.1 glycosyltransferase [Bacteroidales bacterium]MDY0286583.1 glycosyltransferase [Bacteroidales bacterium]
MSREILNTPEEMIQTESLNTNDEIQTKYKYSIIIPHWNIPELLKRCINSIPRRDDIQIIIVDDNSSSDVVDFEQFPDLDRKVDLIFNKKQGGAGLARNKGLEIAKGEWILFADADDFFAEDAFVLFDKYSLSDFDVIHYKHDSCYSENLKKTNRADEYSRLIETYCNNPDKENTLKLRFWTPTPCGKQIRHKIIKTNQIQFDEIMVSNDVMFSAYLGQFTSKHHGVDQSTYVATLRAGSLTQTINKKTLVQRFEVRAKFNKYMKTIGHSNLQMNLASKTLKALFKFGLCEFIKYLKIGFKYNVNIFRGSVKGILDKEKRKKLIS